MIETRMIMPEKIMSVINWSSAAMRPEKLRTMCPGGRFKAHA
jgi:hypothetical protein